MDAPPTPPAAPEPALQTAARLLAEGRLADAVAHLGALVADAPAYAAAHVLHATALEAAGRPSDALEAWGHAALLVPRSPLVRRERARLAALAAPPISEPPAVEPSAEALPAGDSSTDEISAWMGDAPADRSDVPSAGNEPPVEGHATPEPHGEPSSVFEAVRLAEPATPGPDDAAPAAQTVAPEPAADAPSPPPDTHGDDPDLPSLHDYHPGATATPFFDDAADDAVAEPDLAEAAAQTVDWGDLPPLTAPVLAPETLSASDAPPPEPLPDTDWRIVDEAPDEPERPVFEDAFEAPPAPADDLDDLISRLEHAPRIRPDPAFSGPSVTVDESGVDEMVSETLAKIYAAQHRYVEAAVMYEKLAAREPAQADEMLRRAAELRGRR